MYWYTVREFERPQNELVFVILHCSVLYCIAVCCTALYCIVLLCTYIVLVLKQKLFTCIECKGNTLYITLYSYCVFDNKCTVIELYYGYSVSCLHCPLFGGFWSSVLYHIIQCVVICYCVSSLRRFDGVLYYTILCCYDSSLLLCSWS